MKKIILAVIAGTMLISNIAFASTKTANTNSNRNKTVSTLHQNGWIDLNTTDPH